MASLPKHLWSPHDSFKDEYNEKVDEGLSILAQSKVCFVGLARNCDGPLQNNLERFTSTVSHCKDWRLHIESNDCVDNTVQVLMDYSRRNSKATFYHRNLGRQQLSAEFSGPRTVAMAEYRTACQSWVRDCAGDSDFVVVIDWDQWGGWTDLGLANGVGWLSSMPDAYGMTSVSLFQYDWGAGPQWVQYDCWALRGLGQRGCYWDAYRNGAGVFAYQWLPPVGSPPVLVSSAFGGLAVYRTEDYLSGTYRGEEDCEHVTFHKSIADSTGRVLYMCPSMRCVMSWILDSGGSKEEAECESG